MSLENLNGSDIETLRKFLQLSGRAAPERRKALCIEIGINPAELSAVWMLPPNDFAVELIDLLQTRKLENSVYKLCEELKSAFRGGGYEPQLDAIAYKLNPNHNSKPGDSTSTTQPPTEFSPGNRGEKESRALGAGEKELTPAGSSFPHAPVPLSPTSWLRTHLKTLLTGSLTVTVALVGLRFFGVLEGLELKTFDHLIQLRPDEGMDKRLLVIKITDEDILAQDARGEKGQGSLRDPSLNSLLEKLEQHKPRLIGIDLYRPFSADSNVPGLLERLQKNIIAVCKLPLITDAQENPQQEVSPPKEISAKNIGFSDFASDRDDTVRRYLMVQDLVSGAKCRTQESFSFMLARRYLEQELKNTNYQNPLTSGNDLQLGGVVFPQLQPFRGGYPYIDASGFQILLNYRATSSGKVAQELTLEDILNDKFQDEDVRDKIVLIGSYAEQQGPPDRWSTPYGTLNGVMVHAHMMSQILSTVLDKRPLLSTWSQYGEIFWIWSWSLIGGVLACYWRSFKPLAIAVGGGFLVLYITCLTSLIVARVWIPLIPPAIGLVGTSVVRTLVLVFVKED